MGSMRSYSIRRQPRSGWRIPSRPRSPESEADRRERTRLLLVPRPQGSQGRRRSLLDSDRRPRRLPELVRAGASRSQVARGARLPEAGNIPTRRKRQCVSGRNKHRCVDCGTGADLTLDHLTPLSHPVRSPTARTNSPRGAAGAIADAEPVSLAATRPRRKCALGTPSVRPRRPPLAGSDRLTLQIVGRPPPTPTHR